MGDVECLGVRTRIDVYTGRQRAIPAWVTAAQVGDVECLGVRTRIDVHTGRNCAIPAWVTASQVGDVECLGVRTRIDVQQLEIVRFLLKLQPRKWVMLSVWVCAHT